MPQISLMLPVRITEEKFSNFVRYFQSIVDCVNDLKNIEVLVKFDDDQDISKAVEVINEFKGKGVDVQYIVTPRSKGYQSMFLFLLDLFFESSNESILFASQTIDGSFTCKNFDTLLIEASTKHDDGIFVIHPNTVCDLQHFITDINKAVQHVETFPFWSRKWIEIQGNFGYNALTDGYTALVEYFLYREWGVDRRVGINTKLVTETHGEPPVVSKYWQGPRKTAMDIHLSEQSVAFARQAAKNLALNITNSWKKDDYSKYLIEAILKNYDKNLLLEAEQDRLQRRNNELQNHVIQNTAPPAQHSISDNHIDLHIVLARQQYLEHKLAKFNKIKMALIYIIFPPRFVYDKMKKFKNK